MESDNQNPDLENGDLVEKGGRLYTVSQAAQRLRMHETWLYERTRRKVIPHRKLGKYIRFTESDLSAIVQMCFRGQANDVGADKNEE
jgi:excisionase family DNA binding protein